MKTKSFNQLSVCQSAHQFVLGTYKLTSSFPDSEKYGLVPQLRRAAVSIPANIAEGYKRIGVKDKLRFYNIAQSSLEECRYYLILSSDLGFSNNSDMLTLLDEVSYRLESYVHGLIRNSKK